MANILYSHNYDIDLQRIYSFFVDVLQYLQNFFYINNNIIFRLKILSS